VAEAYWAALKFCAVYTLVTWMLMALATESIARSFGLSPDGVAVLRTFTHYAAGSFIFTGALFVANATFNNLARPLWSTVGNWFRDGILMWPLALLGAAWAGASGVIWANACANVIAGTVAVSFGWRYIRSLTRATARTDAAAE
jgi:Na+-driven multidrug efflux pump